MGMVLLEKIDLKVNDWKLKNGFEAILESIYLSRETREKNPNTWRGAECEILKPYDLLSYQ